MTINRKKKFSSAQVALPARQGKATKEVGARGKFSSGREFFRARGQRRSPLWRNRPLLGHWRFHPASGSGTCVAASTGGSTVPRFFSRGGVSMRIPLVALASMCLVTTVGAQSPALKPVAQKQGEVVGTLAQVMRGIFFPNANLIFDVQSIDPTAPKPKMEGAGATATFSNIYTGWQIVENAAISLNQAADLVLVPGRLCQNGKPVPVGRADFEQYAQGLRDASKKVLELAKTKDQEKVSDAANDLADACSSCHEPYRDKGDADSPARCTPPTAAEMERINKGLR
jgi:hypothetical protein